MAPLVIPAGYSECSFIMQQNDTLQPAVCTVGFHTDDPDTGALIATSWETDMLAEMNNSFTYKQFRMVVAGGTLLTLPFNTPGAGGGSGTSPQVSYLIQKLTASPGRKNRGRFYYPGCDETSVDADGRVSSGKLGGLGTMLLAWEDTLAGIPVDPVILHHDATAPTVIVSFQPESVVATQRRRLRRGV